MEILIAILKKTFTNLFRAARLDVLKSVVKRPNIVFRLSVKSPVNDLALLRVHLNVARPRNNRRREPWYLSDALSTAVLQFVRSHVPASVQNTAALWRTGRTDTRWKRTVAHPIIKQKRKTAMISRTRTWTKARNRNTTCSYWRKGKSWKKKRRRDWKKKPKMKLRLLEQNKRKKRIRIAQRVATAHATLDAVGYARCQGINPISAARSTTN